MEAGTENVQVGTSQRRHGRGYQSLNARDGRRFALLKTVPVQLSERCRRHPSQIVERRPHTLHHPLQWIELNPCPACSCPACCHQPLYYVPSGRSLATWRLRRGYSDCKESSDVFVIQWRKCERSGLRRCASRMGGNNSSDRLKQLPAN